MTGRVLDAEAAEAVVAAQLDLATTWRLWGVLQHRDDRVFAGHAGDLAIFGTVMLRLDVPHREGSTTFLFNPNVVDDLLRCSEEVARQIASILDRHAPVTTGAAGLIDAVQSGGGIDGVAR